MYFGFGALFVDLPVSLFLVCLIYSYIRFCVVCLFVGWFVCWLVCLFVCLCRCIHLCVILLLLLLLL